MKTTIKRRIQFCSGHRVVGHEGKCKHMHGHNYVVFFEAEMIEDGLDSIGRVIDFSVLKELLGGWIDENWDHQFLYYKKDPVIVPMLERMLYGTEKDARMVHEGYVPVPFNPTAENMAEYLLNKVAPRLLNGTGVRVVRVVLHETENCEATVTL